MENISAEEIQIIGGLQIENGRAKNDAQSDRVWSLITTKLRKIAVAENGWEQLYQDPKDGRYWELYFPQGELQGGGPPALRVVSSEVAQHKYHLV